MSSSSREEGLGLTIWLPLLELIIHPLTSSKKSLAVISIPIVCDQVEGREVRERMRPVVSASRVSSTLPPLPSVLAHLLLAAHSPITKYRINAAKNATQMVATHAYCGQFGLSVDLDGFVEEGGIVARGSNGGERPADEDGWDDAGK